MFDNSFNCQYNAAGLYMVQKNMTESYPRVKP